MVQGFMNIAAGINKIFDWIDVFFTWLKDLYMNLFNLLVSNPIVDWIKLVLQTVFWLIVKFWMILLTKIIDFIASILPDYTIPVPSVYFGNSKIVALINWVFPVDTFTYCLTIILISIPAAFIARPFLRITLMAK